MDKIIKRPINNIQGLRPGRHMNACLILSLIFHVLIILSFQNVIAFPQKSKEDLRTYRVDIVRPPLSDIDLEPPPNTDITHPKTDQKPAPKILEEDTISLNTEDERYASYTTVIREKIKSQWAYPILAKNNLIEGSLTLVFTLSQNGNRSETRKPKLQTDPPCRIQHLRKLTGQSLQRPSAAKLAAWP